MTLMSPHNAKTKVQPQWLSGQLLIAMPSMSDSRFERTVIFICSHSEDGAMGLVINRLYGALNFSTLLQQLDVTLAPEAPDVDVHFGGPVETSRGFVLHSAEYKREGTGQVTKDISLTATVDILKEMATGAGPRHSLLALGYAAWAGGQLENELQHNGWLVVPSDTALVFDNGLETKWDRAVTKLGITPAHFSGEAGRA
jgi:putative transcriptional regulator